MQDATQLLRAHPGFAELAPGDLARVAATTSEVRLARGEILALEGEPCVSIYFVWEGRVRALKTSPQGREQVVNELRPPQAFYLVPALDGGTLPTTTQAATRTRLLAMARERFLEVLDAYPAVARALLVDFSRRLRRLSALAGELSLYTVPERLARLLLATAETPNAPRMTQHEMATSLGTVREVVARTLADFQDRGWLRLERGRIEILDVEALRELASR